MAQGQSRWTPAGVLGTIVGILGILAIVALLIFLLRWNKDTIKEIVTVRDTSALPTPLPLVTAPAPDTMAATTVEEAPTAQSEPVKSTSTVRKRRAPRPVLSTSNSIEAEERLAEMRAAGNTRARITRSNRGGTTIYQVRR